jgi:hypothetical protein
MTDSEQNFARYTLSYWYKHPEEQKSIVQEHVARIQKGVVAWNFFDQDFKDYLEKNIETGLYSFRGAELSSVDFTTAQFSGIADFTGANFRGYAKFLNATFSHDAYFGEMPSLIDGSQFRKRTTFTGFADFTDATFNKKANFFKTIFNKGVLFESAIFTSDAIFAGAIFKKDAFFKNATFKSFCSFNRATSTKCAPVFVGVQYKTVPLVESFTVPWNRGSDIESYRQLKKFAIDGANHEQEVRFFGLETRCKMHLEYPALTKFSIWLYWVFSNFGQSLLRPLGALVLVWIVATAITISTTMKSPIPTALSSLIMFEHLEPCEAISSNAFRSKLEAIRSQSIGSSLTLPVIAMDRDTVTQRNQCLYGQGGGVPETNRIINGIQQVLSLIFLFLCGLAVRNRFKIK